MGMVLVHLILLHPGTPHVFQDSGEDLLFVLFQVQGIGAQLVDDHVELGGDEGGGVHLLDDAGAGETHAVGEREAVIHRHLGDSFFSLGR